MPFQMGDHNQQWERDLQQGYIRCRQNHSRVLDIFSQHSTFLYVLHHCFHLTVYVMFHTFTPSLTKLAYRRRFYYSFQYCIVCDVLMVCEAPER